MKTSFIFILLSFITSSVYARSSFCPTAELSEEQKAQVKELRKNFKSAVQGLDKKEKRAMWVDFKAQVLETVPTSEEQQAVLAECFDKRKEKHDRKQKNFCPTAELSEEQKAQMKELREGFKDSAQDLSKEEKRAMWADFKAQVLETVPTSEEQQAVLAECFDKRKGKHSRKKRNFCPTAELSEEQKAQVKELRKGFKDSAQDLSKEERRTARKELQQNILNTVPVSEEQKVALTECFENKKRKKRHRK